MFRFTRGLWASPISIIISGIAFAADPAGVQIDEIIVSASPINQTRFDIVQGTSILSGADLADALKGSLGETLAKQPGITSSFFGPFASRPIIRGFDGDRIRILFDGIGSIDASSVSPDHQVGGDAAGAERIEVLRGPSTLLYGSSAVGGVVNIIDGRIPDEVPAKGYAGSTSGGYGSNAREGFANGALNVAVGDNFVVHGDGGWRSNKNYGVKGFSGVEAEGEGIRGRVPNSDGETSHVTGGFSYLWDHGVLGAAVERFDSNYGSPSEPGLVADEPGEDPAAVRIDLRQTRVDGKGEVRDLTGFMTSAQFRFAYGDYEHAELEGAEIGTVFSNEGWEGRIEATHAALGNMEGTFGVQVRRRDFSAVGEEAFVPQTTTKEAAVFMMEQAEFGPVRLEGGVRVQRTSVNNPAAALKRSFTSLALSAGAGYEFLSNTLIGTTLSWTERPPTAEELFSNGPHLATNQFEVGNDRLGQEDALNLEITLKRQVGVLTGSVSVYTTWYDDFISSQQTGNEVDGIPEFRYEATKARYSGFEAEVGWSIFQSADFNLAMDGKIDVVRATDSAAHQPLPRIPPWQYLVGIDARWRQVAGRLEVQGAGRQHRVAPLETSTSGYTFLNAQVAYEWESDPNLRFVIQGQNLTNVFARPHTSFIKDVAPLPGREVRFYVQATF
jgi:iron complex outermembrane receptor protein